MTAAQSQARIGAGSGTSARARTREPGAQARAWLRAVWPGLVLVAAIVAAAFAVRQIPGVGLLSPMIAAIVLGIAVRNTIGAPAAAQPGVGLSARRRLRVGRAPWCELFQCARREQTAAATGA